MLAKIAVVIALLLTALTAPTVVPQPEPAGYPAPYTVGDAPEYTYDFSPTFDAMGTARADIDATLASIKQTQHAPRTATPVDLSTITPAAPTPSAAPQEGYPLP